MYIYHIYIYIYIYYIYIIYILYISYVLYIYIIYIYYIYIIYIYIIYISYIYIDIYIYIYVNIYIFIYIYISYIIYIYRIPNNEYDRYLKKAIPTKIITTFLALILTLNNFIFNSKFYLQIKGCAMGTICTPSYANIFMSEFEEKYIYPLIKNKSVIYLRYKFLWYGLHLKVN